MTVENQPQNVNEEKKKESKNKTTSWEISRQRGRLGLEWASNEATHHSFATLLSVLSSPTVFNHNNNNKFFFFCHRCQIEISCSYQLINASVSFCFFHLHFLFSLMLNFFSLSNFLSSKTLAFCHSYFMHTRFFWILCLFFFAWCGYFVFFFSC